MRRLPQRRRHRPAIRYDAARHGDAPAQHLALRHLARNADGARRPRSDILCSALERNADLPSRRFAAGAGYLSRLPRHSGATAVRHRHAVGKRQVRAVCPRHRQCHALSAGRPGRQARPLRRAGARRHFLRRLPSHGARQQGLGAGGEPAAERLRTAAPSRAESGLQRLRQDLHRQFLCRRHRPPLRAVRRSEDQADEPRAWRRSGLQRQRQNVGAVRHLPHRASADHVQRTTRRSRLRTIDLSGMGVQRLPHRHVTRRAAAVRPRISGAVLPGLSHAEQRYRRQSVSEQDRRDPGAQQLPGSR